MLTEFTSVSSVYGLEVNALALKLTMRMFLRLLKGYGFITVKNTLMSVGMNFYKYPMFY